MSNSGNDEQVSGENGASPMNTRKKHYPNTRYAHRKQERPYVEDLRIKLNRKRQEREQEVKGTGPPPDPNYNFLKDPSRDNSSENTQLPRDSSYNRGSSRRPNFRNRPHRNEFNNKNTPDDKKHKYSEWKSKLTTQPVNIKVELSTSTGERSCILDEENKLPDLKYTPDRNRGDAPKSYNQKQYYNRNYQRGRGRGRGRGSYHPRSDTNPKNTNKEYSSNEEESWDASAEGNQATVQEADENSLDEKMKQLNVTDELIKETKQSSSETKQEQAQTSEDVKKDEQEVKENAESLQTTSSEEANGM